MLGIAKLVAAAISVSFVSGGALVALTGGTGPGAGGSDYGLDTDGDGRFDWLVVRMPLEVDEPNYYNVWATLGSREPFGRGCFGMWIQRGDPSVSVMPPIREGEPYPGPYEDPDPLYPVSWASVREFLEAGAHTISLAFRGTDLGYAGVDGPYVVQAQVFPDGAFGPEPLVGGSGILPPTPVGWSWTYTTGAYDASAFEEPRHAIRFTGRSEDHGLDADGDGLYDFLVLTAPAEVALAGSYYFDASLMVSAGRPDAGMRWVTSTYGTVEFPEGRQIVEARFQGDDIWASGHSGTFDFVLSIYWGGPWFGGGNGTFREGPVPGSGGDFDIYGDTMCGATSAYRHEGWEELVESAAFTGVFADRGEDLDGDGLYDVLAVDAEVEVREGNWFEFSGQLMSLDGSVWIGSDYQGFYLGVGVYTLTLRFSGPAIHASGVDGPYRVDMNLVAAMRDPQATYTTGIYAHTDFDADGQTWPRSHWIANLTADGGAITALVQRGPDVLTVVIEDILTVQAVAADGTVVFEAQDKVYLPSGGDTQSFSFAWSPEPGTYVVLALLGDPAQPSDAVRIVVTV